MGSFAAGSVWRGWAALCLAAGTVVVPLFWEVFSGGSPLRFLALPLRFAWAWWLVRPVLAAGWFPPRILALGVAGFSLTLSAVTLADLWGSLNIHPGWFLTLEWSQRGLLPWLEPLPRWSFRYRPGYLWSLALWNLAEGVILGILLFVWRPVGSAPGKGAGAGETGELPRAPRVATG